MERVISIRGQFYNPTILPFFTWLWGLLHNMEAINNSTLVPEMALMCSWKRNARASLLFKMKRVISIRGQFYNPLFSPFLRDSEAYYITRELKIGRVMIYGAEHSSFTFTTRYSPFQNVEMLLQGWSHCQIRSDLCISMFNVHMRPVVVHTNRTAWMDIKTTNLTLTGTLLWFGTVHLRTVPLGHLFFSFSHELMNKATVGQSAKFSAEIPKVSNFFQVFGEFGCYSWITR